MVMVMLLFVMLLFMMMMMLLLMVVVTAKDSMHKSASAHVLDITQYGKMVSLLGLPAFFDAVVDKSDQSSRDDDTVDENNN